MASGWREYNHHSFNFRLAISWYMTSLKMCCLLLYTDILRLVELGARSWLFSANVPITFIIHYVSYVKPTTIGFYMKLNQKTIMLSCRQSAVLAKLIPWSRWSTLQGSQQQQWWVKHQSYTLGLCVCVRDNTTERLRKAENCNRKCYYNIRLQYTVKTCAPH